MRGAYTRRILDSGIVGIAVALFAMGLLVQSLLEFFGQIPQGEAGVLDFDVFHTAGRMALEGRIAEAYSFETMQVALREARGAESAMAWSYPPPFDLWVAGLGLLPRGVAYAAFILLTFGAYWWVLRRLAGPHVHAVLLAVAPAVMINIKIGQNGFLTGALAGGFCLLALRGRAMAGVPLGLMAIKPHLGLGLGIALLARRGWAAAAIAGLVVVLTSALATLAFGSAIWPAFLQGASEAGAFLRGGSYQLFRMTSLYAALAAAGVPAASAFALQAALALAVLAGTALAVLRINDPRLGLAVAVFGSLLVSPYCYDYDLTLLGIGLALAAPALLARARDGEVLILLLLCWASTGSGLAAVMLTGPELADPGASTRVSLGFPAYGALLGVMARILARAPSPAEQAGAAPPARAGA